jgi:ABC-type phosphate transport system substrate-binding protein
MFLPGQGFLRDRFFAGERIVLCQRLFRILIFVLFAASLAAARDIALVSNKSNALGALSVADLIKLCKAQTTHWPDGKPVTFVMRSPSAPEMRMVLEKVYGMSQSELNSLIVTSNHGRPAHPAILVATSDDELMDKVASTPGAIGVVDVYSINGSVAIVKIGGKLPLEPGYLLHGN